MRLTLQTKAALAAGARSHIYAMLSGVFGFPTPQLARALASGSWLAELSRAASGLPFQLPIPERGAPSDAHAEFAELQRQYISLFDVGAGQPYCPLYEGSHRSGRMKIMEDLVRFYEHFGLKTAPGDHPDHLCAELEFMHYLAFKEAAALDAGESAEGLPAAQRDFLARHLCRWLPRVAARLEARSDGGVLYLSVVSLATDFCRLDLEWLKGVSGKFRLANRASA